jgi:hypothetical protein
VEADKTDAEEKLSTCAAPSVETKSEGRTKSNNKQAIKEADFLCIIPPYYIYGEATDNVFDLLNFVSKRHI